MMDLFGEDPAADDDLFAGEVAEDEGAASVVEGLKAPQQNLLFAGHEACEREILSLYNAGRLPHAFIFSGPEGVGKSTFAFRVARFLLAQKVADGNQDSLFGVPEEPPPAESLSLPEDHATVRRVSSGGHADLLFIERHMDEAKNRRKNTVEVAEIRKVAPFLRKTAAEGGWRVVIVDDADTMNMSSQNALLKILEEPPARTVLILVTHRAGLLLPTIRSRSRVMSFQPLAQDGFDALLRAQGHYIAAEEAQALYRLCAGSIGRALALIDQGGLDVMAKVMAVFQDYPRWKWSQIHVLGEDLSRATQGESFDVFADVMLWASSQLVSAKARGRDLPPGPLQMEAFEGLKAKSSLEDLVKICENLEEHFKSVKHQNLEKRQAVLQAFSLMEG